MMDNISFIGITMFPAVLYICQSCHFHRRRHAMYTFPSRGSSCGWF